MQEHHNPLGLSGFEFIEFSAPDPEYLINRFHQLGMVATARHRSKDVTLYQQGQINFILNAESNSQAAEHAKQHGPGACAMGFRVANAQQALSYAVEHGAKPFISRVAPGELIIPAIRGIGNSVIYFIDRFEEQTVYDIDFVTTLHDANLITAGLIRIDHLTHNVKQGHMDHWAHFYERIFNFREIRYFDIQGQHTGLLSRAMASPCGTIKIPLNESKDEKSQIAEFLTEYKGEGIQHIALTTDDIYSSVEWLRRQDLQFLDVPDTYYQMIVERMDWHHEDLNRLQQDKILIDGGKIEADGLLLQIFTENMFGPAFIEIIQRKGHEGFGEGNFQALFEAIERDQIQRGVLS
ncbi:MAG: 4-hydroxyphenylpyruvate dioxygenase [Legionellales bacterium]|nr:4-hydroxyphenylpyruvate dioxygenase [Legionellales bacterium]